MSIELSQTKDLNLQEILSLAQGKSKVWFDRQLVNELQCEPKRVDFNLSDSPPFKQPDLFKPDFLRAYLVLLANHLLWLKKGGRKSIVFILQILINRNAEINIEEEDDLFEAIERTLVSGGTVRVDEHLLTIEDLLDEAKEEE